MSLPLASIRRSSARRMSACPTTTVRPLMDTRETRHWIRAMYRMALRHPLSATQHHPSTRSFWHSARSRSPRFLSWSSNDLFRQPVTSSSNTSSAISRRTVEQTNKTDSVRPQNVASSSSSSSTNASTNASRDRIEFIAQYPDRAARDMLEPNVALLMRTLETKCSLTHPTEVQSSHLGRPLGAKQAAAAAATGGKTTQDLLRFDPFGSQRSTNSPLQAYSSRVAPRSTMRSQQSMWAARRDHQRSPEYVIQDVQDSVYQQQSFRQATKFEDDIFQQCRPSQGSLPPLETLLMDRLGVHATAPAAATAAGLSTVMASNTQFSGFNPRDFMPLSANGRLGVELFRADNASQEHVILARSSEGPMPATTSTIATTATTFGSGAESGVLENNNNNNNASDLGLPSLSFSSEYDAFMSTIFRADQPAAITSTALEAELFRFGSTVQEQIFDVPSFLQSTWSRQDLVILGLEQVLQEAMKRGVAVTARVQLAELLVRHELQELLSVSTLKAWKRWLMQAPKKTFRAVGIEKTAWKARLEAAVEKIHGHRGAMGQEAWEVRTMGFRTKLALFRKSGILPTSREYRDFMGLGLKAERYETVYQAFHHLLEHGGQADTQLYTMYITALVRQGRMEHAQEVLRGMERMRMTPSVVTYGVMIDGYGKRRDGAGMLAMLQAMQRAGIEPNLPIFSSLLSNLIRSKEFYKALKVHDRLVVSKLELDDTTKNSLVKLLQHTKGSQAAYASLLERLGAGGAIGEHHVSDPDHCLQQGGSSSTTNTTVSPVFKRHGNTSMRRSEAGELAGFNRTLDAFTDAMDVVGFTKAYRTMRERGLSPNQYTFNTLLKLYKRAGSSLRTSLEVLQAMNAKYSWQPDVVAYTTVMQHALATAKAMRHPSHGSTAGTTMTAGTNSTSNSKDNNQDKDFADVGAPMDIAWDLYDEMMQRQVRLDLKAYATLIDMVGQDPGSSRARTMVQRHFIRGPHRLGFTVGRDCDQATGLGLAGTLYVQLLNQGLEPNEMIFGSLMHLVIRRGWVYEVEAIYNEMVARRGMVPNTVLLTNLILGFSHVRDFQAGWQVWEFMVANQVPRNAITYLHLVRLCERCFHPNYLEAMRWPQHQHQHQQQRRSSSSSLRDQYQRQGSKQRGLGLRAEMTRTQEFDRFGVRIERFGEDEEDEEAGKANVKNKQRSERALGLSNTADRVVGSSPGLASYVEQYGLPLTATTSSSSPTTSATSTTTTTATRPRESKSRLRSWVPADVRETIERQMVADGVSWSKVQRFRKGIRQMKPWDPIVARVEQLSATADIATAAATTTTTGDSALSSGEDVGLDAEATTTTTNTTLDERSASSPMSPPQVSNLVAALAFEPKLTRRHRHGDHHSSSNSGGDRDGRGATTDGDDESLLKTLEVAGVGFGHGYVPQQRLPPNVQMGWNRATQAPEVRELQAGQDAEYRALDSKAVLRQYPHLTHDPYEWWKAYRVGVLEKGGRGGENGEHEAAEDAHARRVLKMEKRRVRALQTPAKSSWTEEAVQQMEEEERAYAIPGRL